MNRTRTAILALVLQLAVVSAASASWYDDYEDGVKAAQAGNWSVVIQKMTAAINANGKENNKARTYGAIFINYHPYYYRGAAYLQTGKYEQAISDLERTSGAGEVDLGSIETLIGRAKSRLAAANAPAPEPARPEPTRPSVVTPPVQQPPAATTPQIDGALRQRASAAISAARQKLSAAQQRKATGTQQYVSALSMVTEATTRNATARSNDDLSAVISMAESASDLAELAAAPSVASAPSVATPAPTPLQPRPVAAADAVLDEDKRHLRRALASYFAGEFEVASRDFQTLARRLPQNAWVWAFLGASQYSRYAFEADETFRTQALASFKRARELRSWKGGLPEKYFSRRIRTAFTNASK